jgi:branched-chain amino acid aminotransferase
MGRVRQARRPLASRRGAGEDGAPVYFSLFPDLSRAPRCAPAELEDIRMANPPEVYVNGRYLAAGEAHVSFFDWGLQFGDGVYEVISTWRGAMFRLDDHLDRLDASMHAARLSPGWSRAQWREAVLETTRRSGLREAGTRIIVTRGAQPPGTSDLRACTPNVFIAASPYLFIGSEEQRANGIRLMVSHQRGMSGNSLDPRYKHISRLQYNLARIEAAEAGYDDAVWLSPEGLVQEAPRSNLFAVRNGVLLTPAEGVLSGITRMTFCELARELGIALEIRALGAFDLFVADEVFTCSTSGAALPVREVSGRPVRHAVPGPVTQRLQEAYWRIRAEGRHGTPVFDA